MDTIVSGSGEETMTTIGARELKEHTGQALRQVRETGEEIEITYHGRVVARLVPPTAPQAAESDWAVVWSDLDRLAVEIGSRWPDGFSAVEAVSERRREF